MANVVKRVVIEKLYDEYTYDLTFGEGGVTIITGPNGYGKTTVLNIIKNAIDLEFGYFCDLLFSSITIYFSDAKNGAKLVITRSKSSKYDSNTDESDHYNIKVAFYQGDNRKALESYTIDATRYIKLQERFKQQFLEDDIPFDNYLMHLRYREGKKLRQNLLNYRMFVNDRNCLFIKEQRILSTNRSDDNEAEYTITQLAKDLKRRYSEQKSRYTDKGQAIDSSFIQRSLSSTPHEYDEEEYNKKIAELNKYVEAYQKVGLISNLEFMGEYNEKFKTVLSLYLEDMFEKISVYDEFFRQLSLFNRFVNGKGLSNKKMILNEKDGFCFETDSGNIVPLQKLSSGEQNLVILYYRLVFETAPNTLLLIDEPENSLHVEWLEKMLSDYLVMEDALKCQMIIATHSPTFVNGHWDIAYDLFGGFYQENEK